MSDERSIVSSPVAYSLSVQEVKTQVVKVQELMKELMTDGEHYGASFPGDKKKNLLKPGADKLCFMFRLRPEFEQATTDLGSGHREVYTKCEIYHIESGIKIAEGVGICSTMESKFRWRTATRVCPQCGKDAIIKGKAEYGGGWVCFKKKDGCGATFDDNDTSITDQESGKVENQDIADVWNTVAKMSKKRAYVDATITACAASDIFSQDADDLEPDHTQKQDDSPKARTEPKPEARTEPKPGGQKAPDQKEQYNGIASELARLMKTSYEDGVQVFSEEDKNIVREKTHGLKYSDIEFLQGVFETWKKVLSIRLKNRNSPKMKPAAPIEKAQVDEFTALAEEASTAEEKVFRNTLDLIAQSVSEKDDNGSFWFTEEEKKPYRETAQGIGSMKDKDAKLKAMKDLLLSIQGALAAKQDARIEMNAVADEAFDDSEQDLF